MKEKLSVSGNRRKKPDKNSHGREPLFHSLIEQSSDIVLLINRDSVVTYANARAEKILQRSKDELIDSSLFAYLHPEDFNLVTDVLKKFSDGQQTGFQKIEIRISDNDATWHTVEAVLTNVIHDHEVQAVALNLRDITERKKAEDALRKSEALYRLLAENITEHIWIMDLNLNLTYISPSVEKIYGYPPTEIRKLKLKELFTKESLQIITEALSTELSRAMINPPPPPGTRRVMELQARHKDGHLLWIENRLSFIRDQHGKPVSIMGETRDITERKLYEEKLRNSEERYRTILEDIKEGYFETDLAGNFTFFNDTVSRVMGYPREELMGMNNRQYTDEADLQQVFQAYNQVYETGEPQKDFIWKIRRKDGEKRHIEASISLLKDASGIPIGFRGIAHDITERIQIEKKLKDEEQRFRAVADQSSDIIILVNRDGTITYANRAIDVLGFNPDDRIGFSAFENIHPDDLQSITESFILLFKDPDAPALTTEVRLRHKNGIWKTFEAMGSNLVRDNVIEAAIVNLRDITERKRAEKLLRESEERYRLLADHMKDQVWLMDMNMNITYVSPSVERLTGYSSDEIRKMSWNHLLTPDSLEKATGFISVQMPKALKASPDYLLFKTLELEFILKNGQTVWGECAFSFIRDPDGRVLSILGEARNITERKIAEEKLQQMVESLKRATGTTIQVLVAALEARDPYTAGHQSRTANLACTIAAEMGLDNNKIEGLIMAGMIHDIGKLSIPAEILTKPSKLTTIEFSLIKEHPQSGYEMLKDVESPWPLAEIVRQHHERMNGTGYPRHLQGEEILIEARILAVADVVEAMGSHRPYRPSLGIEAALDEIEKNKGILYDTSVAETCLNLFKNKKYTLA